MLVDCYLRKGTVYIPTMARAPNGMYIAREPISVVPIGDTEALAQAFAAAAERGNPQIPRVDYIEENKKPDVRQYAGVKTWAAFERGAFSWSFTKTNGVFSIRADRKHGGGGWVPDLNSQETMPAGTTIVDACRRVVEVIQAKARETDQLK